MKNFRIANRYTLYLLVGCGLLGYQLDQQLNEVATGGRATASAPAATGFNPPPRDRFSAPGFAAYGEVIERPLFLEGRRPPPEPKPEPVAPVQRQPLRLVLEGIVISADERIAVLLDTSTKEVLHLTAGMEHGGWELVAVTDNVATFKQQERTQELTLEEDFR